MNILMHPPATGATTLKVNGRSYAATVGTPIPVPDFDAAVLEANGWMRAGEYGTTAQRPTTGLFVGREYQDSTVGAHIKWDGKNWRHSQTGTSV